MDVGRLGAGLGAGQHPAAWGTDPPSLLLAGDTESQWLACDRGWTFPHGVRLRESSGPGCVSGPPVGRAGWSQVGP